MTTRSAFLTGAVAAGLLLTKNVVVGQPDNSWLGSSDEFGPVSSPGLGIPISGSLPLYTSAPPPPLSFPVQTAGSQPSSPQLYTAVTPTVAAYDNNNYDFGNDYGNRHGWHGGNHKRYGTPPPLSGPPPPLVVPTPSVTEIIPVIPQTLVVDNQPSMARTSCPTGYSALGTKCVKTVVRPANLACPPGFLPDLDDEYGRCVKVVAKTSECPLGYERSPKGTCTYMQQLNAISICPDGFAQSLETGRCVRAVEGPPELICPPGTQDRNDACVVVLRARPDFTCDLGALEGEQCRIETMYDCTDRHRAPETVSYASTAGLGGATGTFGTGEYGGGKIHKKDRWMQANLVRVVPIRDKVVSKTCKRVAYNPARRSCPDGFMLNGLECVAERAQPKIQGLPSVYEEFADMIITCPDGCTQSVIGNRNTCVSIDEVPLDFFCQPGAIETDTECLYYAPQVYECPPGYVLDDATAGAIIENPLGPLGVEAVILEPVCSKAVVAPMELQVQYGFTCTGNQCTNNGVITPTLPPLETQPEEPSATMTISTPIQIPVRPDNKQRDRRVIKNGRRP